ncbi:unnamed protein product [Urochloa humidicola]
MAASALGLVAGLVSAAAVGQACRVLLPATASASLRWILNGSHRTTELLEADGAQSFVHKLQLSVSKGLPHAVLCSRPKNFERRNKLSRESKTWFQPLC